MNIALTGFVVVLAIAGLQTVRLSDEAADHAKTVATYATERTGLADATRVATEKARTAENQLATANLENANEQARLKADAARRVADAQRAATGLRDTLYSLSRRERPTDSAAAGWFDAAATARGLVGECSDRRTALAEAADSIRTQVIGLQSYVAGVCLAGGN